MKTDFCCWMKLLQDVFWGRTSMFSLCCFLLPGPRKCLVLSVFRVSPFSPVFFSWACMGAYSKSSKADQGGIRRLCNHLLQSADHGPELKQKAQEAKPGSAKRGPLTEEQNLWVRDYVARTHWRNLSSVEKERWNQAPQPNTTTARNEPASASAPATRTSAEPSTVSTSSSSHPRTQKVIPAIG